MSGKENNQPKKVDWEKIELDYRTGIKTLRQIAGENGISHVAIDKRAKRDEWTRDLSTRIQDKAKNLVNKKVVNKAILLTERQITERQIVDVNAESVADILLEHRAAFRRNVAIIERLEVELEGYEGDLNEKVRIAKILTETRRMVVEMQRQAWGIDPKAGTQQVMGEVGARFVVEKVCA